MCRVCLSTYHVRINLRRISKCNLKKSTWVEPSVATPVNADDLSLEHKARYLCQSCSNPLRLYRAHSANRYFEHHLEQAEEESLANCLDLLSLTPSRPAKPPTIFEKAVYEVQHQDNPFLGFPQQQRFHCAMYHYDYDGFRTCP